MLARCTSAMTQFNGHTGNYLVAAGGGTATGTGSIAIGHDSSADRGGVAYGRLLRVLPPIVQPTVLLQKH